MQKSLRKQIQEKYDEEHSLFEIDKKPNKERPCDLAVCQLGAPVLLILMFLIRLVSSLCA